jgi:hypothetical protein
LGSIRVSISTSAPDGPLIGPAEGTLPTCRGRSGAPRPGQRAFDARGHYDTIVILLEVRIAAPVPRRGRRQPADRPVECLFELGRGPLVAAPGDGKGEPAPGTSGVRKREACAIGEAVAFLDVEDREEQDARLPVAHDAGRAIRIACELDADASLVDDDHERDLGGIGD